MANSAGTGNNEKGGLGDILRVFSLAMEQSREGIALSDLEGKILYVNPAFAEAHGFRVEELLGENLTIFHKPEHLEKVHAANRKILESGEFKGEILHARRDGSEFPALMHNTLIRDEDGRPIAMLGTLVDISERKELERSLEEGQRFLSNVFASIQDGISVLDNELNIVRVNPTMERWYSHAMPLTGKKCYEAYHCRNEPCSICPTRQTIKNHVAAKELVPKTGPDGTVNGWLDLYSFPLVDTRSGELMGVIEYVRDVTEQKEMEEKLRVSQKMEAVGRLAGGLAHDLNNILGAITGYTDLALVELRQDDPLRKDFEEVQKAAQRAAGLTRHLLAFSRRQMVNPKVIHLNEVVTDMKKMLSRLIDEDIELSTMFTDANDCLLIDPGQMEQVIMNLCVNARDAMSGGGRLSIETAVVGAEKAPVGDRSSAEKAAERYVVLKVGDTGCGMDGETRDKIFEPFFTTKQNGRGTGLGLSTVYGIVKQANGAIQVDSQPGSGSVFSLYFPQAEGKSEVEVEAASSEVRGTETILVVEDEGILLDPVARMLRKYGYRTLKARNAGEALLVCEKNSETIDLLLTDIVMPMMNGRELAERLGDEQPNMRVLFMTGYPGDSVADRGLLDGEMNFIYKPFSGLELVKKVREVLDGRPAG